MYPLALAGNQKLAPMFTNFEFIDLNVNYTGPATPFEDFFHLWSIIILDASINFSFWIFIK